VKFTRLPSAISDESFEHRSKVDGLPLRDSGSWMEEKHKKLAYFANIFSVGMKPTEFKKGWVNRVYLELFSGPGRCYVREGKVEDKGSPLKVIDSEFSRYIFCEINEVAAKALAARIKDHPNSDKVEIWNGDCAEAIDHIQIPSDSLTFAFIDPTGIAHLPFTLIKKLRKKTRCDLLINVQHAMGIKMNIHQYTPDADEDCALTQFLGHDGWKQFCGRPARAFFQGVLGLYRGQLDKVGFTFTGNDVMVHKGSRQPLYLLLFATGHPRGQDFWNKAVKGTTAQQEFSL
jgi:three-Cys-motif partner protein